MDEKTGADRVYQDLKKSCNRNEDKNLKTKADVLKSMDNRLKSDCLRYKKYFNINVFDKKQYDFALDTTSLTKEEVFDRVYAYIKKEIKMRRKIDKK